MSEELVNSLVITIIGMGLVFMAIILLWGMMEVLVRFSPEKGHKEIPESSTGIPGSDPGLKEELESAKQAAVVAAVAVAMALSKQNVQVIRAKSIQELSPWQSVKRAERFQNHQATYNRKIKGDPGNENKG